ncbi:NAD(P)H-binding protein [Aeromicrobium sp. CF4.19]|uniref:NAD(P)H-binding protein n=1 Tax=Aeromicrobium sp. CF4.19 TaxID=3373082 RepID=UPI003EE56107
MQQGNDVTRVLVTGVRGKTGAPLAEQLVARGDVEVLGGSSDPSTVTAQGVRPTTFSWDDPAAWVAATDGIDAVYVVRPDRPDAPELIETLLASTAPEVRVVLLSEKDPDEIGPEAWALRAEKVVREGRHAWTIVRPSWFMQVLTDPRFYRDPVVEAGELPFPSNGMSLAWIDARDIAAVAEQALLDERYGGEVLELTGPEVVSLPRTAELLSEASGRPVVHRETTVDEALVGTEGFERELSALTFQRVHAGTFSVVTATVERVTGRPARTLQTFLADHRSDLL